MSGMILAALMSAFLLSSSGANAQQTNDTASPPPSRELNIGDITQLLNETLKAYSEVAAELNADVDQESNALPNQSAEALEGLVKKLAESDELSEAIANTAKSVGVLERTGSNLWSLLIDIGGAVMASALTLAGDRALRRRKLSRRVKAIQG